ncbi:MAG TPA: acyl-CoA dehydrogenase family protein [Oligoflexia bacterium]|nr:acyl-CoA dehydrogenase family protein [Oligoflexia bacterium]HMR24533.1 acyl-CoA dehydrogenase family protein [Oligoflexia bacterium]
MSEAYIRDLDFVNADLLLSDEDKMVRQTVRDFVDQEVLPIIQKHYRAGSFPKELVKPMANLGLLGANLHGYDCAGMGSKAYGLVMQELERGDSGIRSFASVQGALCMYPIYAFGSEEQKQQWLPKMAAGEVIGCFGLTEPDFGSNPAGMITRAEKKGNKWIIHGTKMWITNGCNAHIAIIWAKTEDGIRGFIVETDREGFEATQVTGKLSLRASDTAELSLDQVEIPEENMLPEVKGLKGPLSCLSQARYGIAWGAIGAAKACFSEVLSYSKNRIQFDKPIASFQLVQRKLTNMATEITKAQLLANQLAELKDKGQIKPAHISMGKMNNVKMALEVAREARSILGGNGVLDEYCSMRHMMNLESVFTYEGTDDIHTLIVAHELTGIPAYN